MFLIPKALHRPLSLDPITAVYRCQSMALEEQFGTSDGLGSPPVAILSYILFFRCDVDPDEKAYTGAACCVHIGLFL